MTTAPPQPISDATQPYVDRLLGTQVGEYHVQERVCEGRYGTIYRCRQPSTGQEVTLEVLRTALIGNDEEVRAVNATRCPGIATVSGFGQLPDARRYRLMEPLEGESLDQALRRRGRLPAVEVARLLAQVAGVLEVAHAWAMTHGCLGASSVFLAGGSVKLIDFGLSMQPVVPAQDLRALGALGFMLLSGQEVDDRAPPPINDATPEPLDRLLRGLMEGRLKDATEARKELEGLAGSLDAPQPQPQPQPPASRRQRKPRGLVLATVAVLSAAVGVAIFAWPGAPGAGLPVVPPDEYDLAPAGEAPDESVDEQAGEPAGTGAPAPPPKSPRPAPRVPSAKALHEEIARLETRLRREARPGDDVEQALFVLNKQRLRLSGSPTVEDRQGVAQQLAGWRRSYLRP